jgi:hypothetical protein
MEYVQKINNQLKIINEYNLTIDIPIIKEINSIEELDENGLILNNSVEENTEIKFNMPNTVIIGEEVSNKKASFSITGDMDISELTAKLEIIDTVNPIKLKPANNIFLLKHGYDPFRTERSVKNAKISILEENELVADEEIIYLENIIPQITASVDFQNFENSYPKDSSTLLKAIEDMVGIVQEQLTLETNKAIVTNELGTTVPTSVRIKNTITKSMRRPKLKLTNTGNAPGAVVGKNLDGLFNEILGIFGFDKNGKWSLDTFLKTGYLKLRRNEKGDGALLVLGNDIPEFPIILDSNGFKYRYGKLGYFKEDFDKLEQEYEDIPETEKELQQNFILYTKNPKIKADKKKVEAKSKTKPLKIENTIEDLKVNSERVVQGKIKTFFNIEDMIQDMDYVQANIDGMLMGIKERWDPKPITTPINLRRAKYRSQAIQYMIERGPDFMSNCFDVALVTTTVEGVRQKIPYIYAWDSYTMITKSIAVRTASIEIPMPKTKTYETKFLTHTISRTASAIDWKTQSALILDLDEPLYLLDMVNDAIGQGIVKTGLGTSLGELIPETRKKNYNSQSMYMNPRIDLMVSHVSLMRDYNSMLTEKFERPDILQWKLPPDQLPFWVFEDIKFLGNEGDIKFERETANTNQITIPFIYRRLYLVDMTGEENPSLHTYGEGKNTRGSWEAESFITKENSIL